MTPQFADRVAIVTGAGDGIGAVTAACLALEGASVVLVDRDRHRVNTSARSIEANGGIALAIAADLVDDDAGDRIVASTIESFGRVDVLINNAGFFPAGEGRLHESGSTRKLWDLTIDVNLRAAVQMCAAVLGPMVESRSGAIVNTSSAQGRAGDVAWASYGIAKAGVESLTRYVATQYGRDGIRCNAVAPGLTGTPNALRRLPPEHAAGVAAQTSLGRLGRPSEVADAVLFLASDRASFVTGQVLAVDGGLLSHMPPADAGPFVG